MFIQNKPSRAVSAETHTPRQVLGPKGTFMAESMVPLGQMHCLKEQ